MATIASLDVQLGADSTRLNKGLTKARKRTKRFSKGAGSDFKKVGAALLGAFSIRAIGGLLSNVDKLAKTITGLAVDAQKFQLTTQTLAEFGVEANATADIFQKLQKNIGEATRESSAQAREINALGLSYNELNGLGIDEQFLTIVDALRGISNGNDKARIGNALLGRGYKELLPVLNGTSEAFNQVYANNKELKAVISAQQLKNIETFNDSIGRTSNVLQAIGVDILDGIFGAEAGKGVDKFNKLLAENREVIIKSARAVVKLTTAFILYTAATVAATIATGALAFSAKKIITILAAIGIVTYEFKDDIGGFFGNATEGATAATNELNAMLETVRKLNDTLDTSFTLPSARDYVNIDETADQPQQFPSPLLGLQDMIDNGDMILVGDALGDQLSQGLADGFQNGVTTTQDLIRGLSTTAEGVALTSKSSVGEIASASVKGIGAVFQGFATTSKSAFKANKAFQIASALIDAQRGFVAGLASPFPLNIILPAAALASGLAAVQRIRAQKFNPPARFGGQIRGGLPGLVGENGPELFVPQNNGTIIPNPADGGSFGNTSVGSVIIQVGAGASPADVSDIFSDDYIDKVANLENELGNANQFTNQRYA